MSFTEKLDALMAKRHINKSTLSKEADIPYTTINGFYKKGSDNIKLSTLKKLGTYFNCTLDYLVDNENTDLPVSTIATRFCGNSKVQRAELLKQLMISKNMKVSDIVKSSGLPYSTVKAILERGAEKAGYINVCKICNALGITADELERMVAENNYYPTTIAAHFDGDEYTEEELEDIKAYAEFVKNRRK